MRLRSKIKAKFRTFPVAKIRLGWDKRNVWVTSKLQPEPNLWYAFGGAPLRGLVNYSRRLWLKHTAVKHETSRLYCLLVRRTIGVTVSANVWAPPVLRVLSFIIHPVAAPVNLLLQGITLSSSPQSGIWKWAPIEIKCIAFWRDFCHIRNKTLSINLAKLWETWEVRHPRSKKVGVRVSPYPHKWRSFSIKRISMERE